MAPPFLVTSLAVQKGVLGTVESRGDTVFNTGFVPKPTLDTPEAARGAQNKRKLEALDGALAQQTTKRAELEARKATALAARAVHPDPTLFHLGVLCSHLTTRPGSRSSSSTAATSRVDLSLLTVRHGGTRAYGGTGRGAQGATGSQEEQTATREARLHALATMEARATKLQAELDSHKENNPEHFNRLSVCPVRRVLVLGRLPQVMVETLPYGFAGTSPLYARVVLYGAHSVAAPSLWLTPRGTDVSRGAGGPGARRHQPLDRQHLHAPEVVLKNHGPGGAQKRLQAAGCQPRHAGLCGRREVRVSSHFGAM